MGENDSLDSILSEVYHALSASRRRHVIQLLYDAEDRTLSVRNLAREITAIEQGVPINRATGESYRSVYNALTQTHLPTLADADIVIYNTDRQTVTAGPDLNITTLLIVLNHTTYRTLQRDSFSNAEN